ncbi:MAG: hypothetical protein AAF458_12290 [Pseudomonadota bacterium]
MRLVQARNALLGHKVPQTPENQLEGDIDVDFVSHDAVRAITGLLSWYCIDNGFRFSRKCAAVLPPTADIVRDIA